MISRDIWRAEIVCQGNKIVRADVPVNSGSVEKDGIMLEMKTAAEGPVTTGSVEVAVLPETLADTAYLAMERPVRVSVPVTEVPERITAFYMFNPWWTRPAFLRSLEEVPERTQIALLKMKDRCVCVLPMVGKSFKTTLAGGKNDELVFLMTACLGGLGRVSEPLFVMGEGRTAAEAVHRVFGFLTEKTGLRLREERRLPEMFRYLGWCSWDAFYTDVTEAKIREKAEELAEKQVPVRWILIDDGWFGAREKMLADMRPDKEKFPDGFKAMTDDIRQMTSVRWFGVWHALGGYWDGTAPESEAAEAEAGSLFRNFAGRLVPDPVRGASFYRDWYEILRSEGIDFVKVDGQSAVPFYYKNSFPAAEAARRIHFSLESGASLMDGAMINCMGMAMENILARPSSAVSRNSDDFLPAKEESFAEHLLQNAYNAVYHNEVYCCDWDMFWTNHKHARKHALLRAISGGPVYVSDRIGATEPDVLKPLVYADGRVLMMERSAQPTEGCIFRDPMKEGVLKLHNYGRYGSGRAGGIAACNLTDEEQAYEVSPSEVPELDAAGDYLIYDFKERCVCVPDGGSVTGRLAPDDYKWYVFVPKGRNGSCLGLADKYAGFTAAEALFSEGDTDTVILAGTGNVSWISERRPVSVSAGGADVTGQMESAGLLHTLKLPESAEKTVVTVVWED